MTTLKAAIARTSITQRLGMAAIVAAALVVSTMPASAGTEDMGLPGLLMLESINRTCERTGSYDKPTYEVVKGLYDDRALALCYAQGDRACGEAETLGAQGARNYIDGAEGSYYLEKVDNVCAALVELATN